MENKDKILLAAGIGLIISDIVPTPADAVFFYQQRKNKQKLENGEITPKQYWTRDAFLYYGLNPLWWAAVVGLSFGLGKTFEQKRNILIGIIAGGAVIGVLSKNIKEDKKYYEAKNGENKTYI